MKIKINFFALIVSLSMITMNSCVEENTGKAFYSADKVTITNYIKSNPGNYSMWLQIMDAADISNALAAYNPYGNRFTLFLPTNKAIQEFIDETTLYNSFEELLADKSFVSSLAKYHVINKQVSSIDFTFGTLPDTTVTGDYITISFLNDFENDSTSILINNSAYVIEKDIEQSNGYIHVINKLLEPVVFSAYEWIQKEPSLSIFAKALEETGVKDSMDVYLDESTNLRNRITVWVVSDDVFARRNIFSYDDLLQRFDNTGNVKDANNNLKLFMAYHVMKGDYYLNTIAEGATGTYETYAALPLKVSYGEEVKLNEGGALSDTIFTGNDTLPITYVRVLYDISNRSTMNGPVHFVSDLLEIEKVGHGNRSWRFRDDEPIIEEIRSRYGGSRDYSEIFNNSDDFNWIKVKGVPWFGYSTMSLGNNNNGYFFFDGNFIIDFTTTKLLPGKYSLQVQAWRKASNNRNATVQFYWNGFRMGGPIDTNIGQSGNSPPYITLGDIEVTRFQRQKLTIEAVKGGEFTLFTVQVIAK